MNNVICLASSSHSRVGQLQTLVLPPLEHIVHKDAVLAATQQEEVAPIVEDLQMLPGNEARRSHVDVHVSQFAVPPDRDPLLGHVELEVPAF